VYDNEEMKTVYSKITSIYNNEQTLKKTRLIKNHICAQNKMRINSV